ncbi:MAG: AAA family ATPase, partial [Anaerolineales bacterium]
MIPIRLEITNFLAYRQPAPLDFTGIHVAVLAGENGAGKSSLLDAITWALWGRSRAKADTELIHQGQTEMRVEFTFALGEQVYRVIRTRKVGKGGGSLLDLQAANAAGDFVSIGEATIPKTQEKILRVLRLSYETFINSAYLVQGQADEFTGKRPTERKQVLADILGLQEWERYEARAKEKLAVIKERIAGVEALLGEIEQELDRREEYERELSDSQARVITVAERLRAAEAGWTAIETARQANTALQRQLADLSKRSQSAQTEIGLLDADLREAALRADTGRLKRQLELDEHTLVDLDKQEAEKEQVSLARQLVAEQSASLRGQNEAARTEADVLKKRLEILEAATEPICPTCGQPLATAAHTELLERLGAEVDARRSQYRENAAQLKKLTDEQAADDRQIATLTSNLRGKAALVKRVAEQQAALSQAGEYQARIAGLTQRRATWAASLAADQAEQARLNLEAEQYRLVLRDSEARQRALDLLRIDDSDSKFRVGAAKQKLAALEDQARQREKRRAERLQLAEEHGVYEEL